MNFKEKLKGIDNINMPESSVLCHFDNQTGSSTDRASPYKNRLL